MFYFNPSGSSNSSVTLELPVRPTNLEARMFTTFPLDTWS